MNIKEFLILKVCDVLPHDLKYYIIDIVRDDSARCIQRLYSLKIAKNVDIFINIMNINNNINLYDIKYINNYVKYIMKNITYTYIQEPGTWIEYLEDIILIYSDRWRCSYECSRSHLHINDINYIMNNIKNANEIYKNTGIEWWNNF